MTDDEVYGYLGQVFEWDRAKAARNAMVHKVRFTEAASVFFDNGAEYSRTLLIRIARSDTLSSAGQRRRSRFGGACLARATNTDYQCSPGNGLGKETT